MFNLYSYFLKESSTNFPLSLFILNQASSILSFISAVSVFKFRKPFKAPQTQFSCLTASSKLDSILFAIVGVVVVVAVGPKVGDAFNTWTLSSRALGRNESRVYWKRLKRLNLIKMKAKPWYEWYHSYIYSVKILLLGLLRKLDKFFYFQL